GYILGSAAAALDVVKTVLPTVIVAIGAAVAAPPAIRAARPLFWVVFVVLTGWSFYSSLSLQHQSVVAQRGAAGAGKVELAEKQAELARIDAKLEALRVEPAREPKAGELAAKEQHALFGPSRSNGCRNATVGSSRAFCAEWERLRAAVAMLRPRAEIRADADAARRARPGVAARVRQLRDQAAAPPDATLAAAAAAAGVTRQSAELIRAAWMSAAYEAGGSFAGMLAFVIGAIGVSRRASAPAPSREARTAPAPPARRRRPQARRLDHEQIAEAVRLLSTRDPTTGALPSRRSVARQLDIAESTLRDSLVRAGIEVLPQRAAG
ncbi:MAG: hypothetical protein AAFR16_09590, partial [Pseudomonadota bacterium]